MPIHLILYGTDGCHLCDQAYELMMPAMAQERITVTHSDILDDPRLEERYSIRIPVIQDAASLRELGWPFDLDQLEEFLGQLQDH
jgi:hypothetical protein